jgi:hypothetical protein
MKKTDPNALNDYLSILREQQPMETDPYFYTRLRAKMEKQHEPVQWPLRPAWIFGILVLLLCVNLFTLLPKNKTSDPSAKTETIEDFASAYDQTIKTYY